ncbi:DUF5063 domain-containing protein [Nevskia soli]|uniref:DUF5063 domain-containing protein n=1 Tax=Nevskia soli TaxID=418856 RepID=UPI00146FFE1E|nr:DUF5063 domain-containing protein [Nevskia soli]
MNSGATEKFAVLARSYCSWAEGTPESPKQEAIRALSLLTELYGCALTLPEVFEDGEVETISHEDYALVLKRFGALPFNFYANCFDPLAVPVEQPVVADLADDLADIWRDLKKGLSLFDAGHHVAAAWDWRFAFHTHWGRHAAAALHPLHCWLAQNVGDLR